MIYDFLFEGHCASDFDLVLASADGANLSESLGIATPEAITVQPVLGDRQFFIRNHYTTMLQKTLRLLHFDRISCQVTPLSTAMQEEIIRWLCREDGYHPFCFLDPEEPDSVYFDVRINAGVLELAGSPCGFELTLETNCPYGYQPVHIIRSISADAPALTIQDPSSRVGSSPVNLFLLYQGEENQTLEIENSFDHRKTRITGCHSGEMLQLTELHTISSSIRQDEIANAFNYVFPTVSNTLGRRTNVFTFSQPCQVELDYKAYRKVGF